jgi:hypothetical protein
MGRPDLTEQPGAKPSADSSEPETGVPPGESTHGASDEQRQAFLKRTVAELTREWRASVREYREFEVLLVRGEPVSHDRHLLVLTALAVLALVAGQVIGGGFTTWAATASVPAAYGLLWLFLEVTGGEEFERVSVDEQGRLHSVKSGRSVDTRGDFVRVALPLAVIAVTGNFAASLMLDIAFPPPPRCNVPEIYWPQSCFTFPRLGGGGGIATDAPAPSATTPDTTTLPVVPGALSVAETQQLERVVHVYLLVAVLCFLLPTLWFLFRMLTGRPVAFVRPISRTRRK